MYCRNYVYNTQCICIKYIIRFHGISVGYRGLGKHIECYLQIYFKKMAYMIVGVCKFKIHRAGLLLEAQVRALQS